ncbi:MAG: hypothetical protein AVDCRST_MAG41-428 [uncultured Corynebacteriales bacterium]|uniref:Arginine/ornithine antiporter ArcD n=1 Tax=uncultured Mycobacteriales bacterium TaxID=581187 RepID=A0A6J4HDG5_9ACTN|nr:MAG: hypothetical protein AVDCRST_MAG41-428 [uncultured Corynebacteriales bacterium]
MGLPVKLADIAPRVATGAFILQSGLGKRNADEEHAAGLHGMATGAYPALGKLEPTKFVKLLAAGEITLGVALLAPVVPTALAGAGLAAFAGGLLGMYAKTPGLHEDGSLKPTPQGIGIAKDVWMLGIGLGFVTQGLVDRRAKKRS